jgi:uncharacterized phage protein (TIGR02218 family)
MKSMSVALKSHYALGTTTLATLVKLVRTDGEELAICLDHDMPVTYDGDTYEPSLGLNPSNIETSSNLSVDNLDAKGALMLIGVSEAEIDAGLWDMCAVTVIRVNWADLTMGCEKLKRGHFGQLSIGRNSFNAEIRGITQRLQQTIGDIVTPACNADLFDARCGLTATEGVWKFSATAVTAFTSRQHFTASSLAQAASFFDAGKVTWTTGLNTGLSKEIKAHTTGGVFELQEPMPFAIAVSDQAIFFVGCRKRFTEDCATKFSNSINFRGFVTIPGQDQMFKGI